MLFCKVDINLIVLDVVEVLLSLGVSWLDIRIRILIWWYFNRWIVRNDDKWNYITVVWNKIEVVDFESREVNRCCIGGFIDLRINGVGVYMWE